MDICGSAAAPSNLPDDRRTACPMNLDGGFPMPAASMRVARLAPPAASRFLAIFLLGLLAMAAVAAGGLLALERRGLLPAPPLTGTWCFNEKFAFLRGVELGEQTLLAVGSSATWRNLDAPLLERRLPGTRAVNAAPCYLQMDQTAFLADVLLPQMPKVTTVLAIIAPRDFESCPPAQAAFFDPALTRAYLAGTLPGWLPYVTGFRPLWLLREALRIRRSREAKVLNLVEDSHGSSILRRQGSYWPEPVFDPRCFEALPRLEAAAAAHGARLVLATLPTKPRWAEDFDPDGARVAEWMRSVTGALRRADTLVADGRVLAWDNGRFADAVHLLYPHHSAYTEFLADALARAARPGASSGG
jgi:hypothetical protein